MDLAGDVVELGPGVTTLAKGDAVFGCADVMVSALQSHHSTGRVAATAGHLLRHWTEFPWAFTLAPFVCTIPLCWHHSPVFAPPVTVC